MTDLSFVPFEEIQAELNRRFPAYVLAFRYYPEGSKNQTERLAIHAATGAGTELLGLANWASAAIHQHMTVAFTRNIPPLDPEGRQS